MRILTDNWNVITLCRRWDGRGCSSGKGELNTGQRVFGQWPVTY